MAYTKKKRDHPLLNVKMLLNAVNFIYAQSKFEKKNKS